MHQHINITLIACSVLYLHNDPSIAYSWSIVNIRTTNSCWTCVVYSATLNYLHQRKTHTSANIIHIKETIVKHKLQLENIKTIYLNTGTQLSQLVVPKALYCMTYNCLHSNGKHAYIARPRWSIFNNLQKANHIGLSLITCNWEHSNRIWNQNDFLNFY
jgi:hypothetical protein